MPDVVENWKNDRRSSQSTESDRLAEYRLYSLADHPQHKQPKPSTAGLQRDTIQPSSVRQTEFGDCFFEASLASLASTKHGKKVIADMIRKHSDGSYSVTFPGDKHNPISVSAKELAASHSTNQGWAKVIETAFIKRNNSGLTGFLKQDGIATFEPNTTPTGAMKLLTGADAATEQLAPYALGSRQLIKMGATSPQNVADTLEKALRSDKPVIASTGINQTAFLGLANDSQSLPDAHVYSVLSYDAKNHTVVVRNPWGTNAGTKLATEGKTVDGITNVGDGKLSMSLETFQKRFTQVDVGETSAIGTSFGNILKDRRRAMQNAVEAGKALGHGDFSTSFKRAGQSITNEVYAGSETLYMVTSAAFDHVVDVVRHPVEAATGALVAKKTADFVNAVRENGAVKNAAEQLKKSSKLITPLLPDVELHF